MPPPAMRTLNGLFDMMSMPMMRSPKVLGSERKVNQAVRYDREEAFPLVLFRLESEGAQVVVK